MKNRGIKILLLVEIIFAALLVGFFIGRNIGSTPIRISDAPSPTVSTDASGQPQKKVNINTATAAQLQDLPGIGSVLAQRIVDYRNTHGPFTTVAELTNVEGIGMEKLANLLDYATTGGQS